MTSPYQLPIEKRWHPISENPPCFGIFIVWAKSADPEKPFRHMSFFSPDEGWYGLVPVWQKAISHWHPLPDDPVTLRPEDPLGQPLPP